MLIVQICIVVLEGLFPGLVFTNLPHFRDDQAEVLREMQGSFLGVATPRCHHPQFLGITVLSGSTDDQILWNVAWLREAPLRKMQGLFGHCPNSDCTPPPPSLKRALYFRTNLSKCHLNVNFHCISAPNHPGKGSDHPNQANAPLNMDNSSQNKCPKPFGQGSRPPPIWAMPK